MIPADTLTESRGSVGGVRTKTRAVSPGSSWLAALAYARRSVGLRVRVAAKRDELDRALAAGVDPAAGPELAFRAGRLVRERDRRGLAGCLRLVIAQADGSPWLTRASSREIRRGEILADRPSLVSLIERLESPRPVVAEGVAIAERLLTNLHSPLFDWAEPGTIKRLACRAVSAMEPPEQPHLPVACAVSFDGARAAERAG